MKKAFKYLFLFLFLFFTSSCEKGFEEINENPFFPTQTDIGPLFNQVVSSLQLGWNEQFYMHNETLYGLTQQAALTAETFQNVSIGTEDMWGNYYTALAHIRAIESRLDATAVELGETEAESLNNVRAMLKIILAYKTFRLTDMFGDMPFFDAGRGFEDLQFARPKFDSQESIYKFCLEELEWASTNINVFPDPQTEAGTPYLSIGEFDTFFDGTMSGWLKFANSLRLRHALRMVEKDRAYAGNVIKDIFENNLPLIRDGEDVVMSPSNQSWLRQSSHWSFREHNKLRMGSTMWSMLSEGDAVNGSEIFDPRAYLFFETNNEEEWIAFPQNGGDGVEPSGGTPYGGQRDVNFALKGNANIYSPVNYYLIRDEMEVPEIIMTAAEVHFLKAEVYLRGIGVAENVGSAEAEYTSGVVASINFWQNVQSGTTIWENAPESLSSGQIFQVVNHPKLSIFSSEEKLQLVYNQRWLDAFRQPWEAYSLARRTGQTPRQGAALQHFRFVYPPSEIENNPENWSAQSAAMGGDETSNKVWWNAF